METVSSILPVIVLLLIGILCRKKQIITSSGIDGLQSLVMNIALPAGLFLTFFNASLAPETIAYPAIIFTVNALGVPLGRLLCRLCRIKERFLPFAMTTSEDGMIGYTLLLLLIGRSEMTTFALMDIGQVLGFFVVTYQILNHELTGARVSVRGILRSIFTTPLLVAMLAGIFCSATGLSALVNATAFAPVLENLCNFISAPTSAAILLVIGYHINFRHIRPGRLFGAIGMRMLQQGLICALVLTLFHFMGGDFASRLTTLSVIAMMILPGSYLLPIYVEPEEEKEFYASVISGYTVLSILGFILLTIVCAYI